MPSIITQGLGSPLLVTGGFGGAGGGGGGPPPVIALNITTELTVLLRVDELVVNGLASGTVEALYRFAQTLLNGTGAGKSDISWSTPAGHATPAGAPETWTVSAMVDQQGRACDFARVRIALLANQSATDGDDLLWGAAPTHPWVAPFGGATDRRRVPPGGIDLLVGPLASALPVVPGVSDQLLIDPGAATIPYALILVGE